MSLELMIVGVTSYNWEAGRINRDARCGKSTMRCAYNEFRLQYISLCVKLKSTCKTIATGIFVEWSQISCKLGCDVPNFFT